MSKLAKALSGSAGNAGESLYVEDVFSTYLYDGTGTTNNIVNGVDLTEGGLVWIKTRDDVEDHNLVDSERGSNKGLESNTTDAETGSAGFSTFNSNGFTLTGGFGKTNSTSSTYASWTFRKAEKFFDVVTWTGDGSSPLQTVSHSLETSPAVIIAKRTDTSGSWWVWHKDFISNQYYMLLNSSAGQANGGTTLWETTDTTFSVSSATGLTTSGGSYVAYLFASDAGGFGADGSESVVKCGSFNGAANTEVDLGFEPQYIMFKNTTSASNWQIVDMMRGMPVGSDDRQLMANSTNAESDNGLTTVTATGFTWLPSASGNTYIYIAIRRPMKTPESGTEVFAPVLGVTAGTTITGFPVDYTIARNPSASQQNFAFTRMLGENYLATQSTAAESATGIGNQFDVQNGIKLSGWFGVNSTVISWNFKRAAGFMDVVAYTGNGTAGATQAHNLGVAPEFMIVKSRGSVRQWVTYDSTNGATGRMNLDDNGSWGAALQYWNNTAPTDSVFTLGTQYDVNQSSIAYIAYLFASVAGVSKVGSYTGTGADLNVDCGFTAGARFILIKRTDSTGDWYTYDSARGIVSGNDPYLLLNTTGAEVTNTDYIDPLASGFTVTSSAPAGLNANGGTYIFLAIA